MKTLSKTLALSAAACTLLAVSACAKPKSKAAQQEPAAAAANAAAPAQTNPEIEKLGRVLQAMSPRCKAAIPNGSPEEFLSDLHTVLAEQESFRSDDLSLFYLIDKKHNVGSGYEPKDLMPVKNNNLWNVSRNDLSLRPEAYAGLEALSRAALADGIKLMVSSTYRSYAYQERLFNRYVAADGEELPNATARAPAPASTSWVWQSILVPSPMTGATPKWADGSTSMPPITAGRSAFRRATRISPATCGNAGISATSA